MTNSHFRFTTLLLIAIFAASAFGQVRAVNDYGVLGLGQEIQKLQTTGSVMMIGAHPDDEDSALLAYLARGEHARTAYLSLTRGDGGQNIIGPELFEPLGIIRTEELLQARRLDGAEQYFSRAFDYGFSKTLDEAKSKWPADVVKCDVVRAIRNFRPLVVISRFTGTPRDGHGQHQYAGFITPLAVAAAADQGQCPGSGEAWRVLKFYVEQGFGENAEPTLRINTGAFDPILGRSYFEIAMEGRSLHRSQGEGRIEFHGDIFSGLDLVGAAADKREKDIFDGIGVSVGGLPALTKNSEEPFRDKVAKLNQMVLELGRRASLFDPKANLGDLAAIYKAADEIEGSTRVRDSKFRAREIKQKAADAIQMAADIEIDALSDRETVVPGEDLMVSVKAFQAKDTEAKIGEITLSAPKAWSVRKIEPPQQNNAAFNSREVAAAGAVFTLKPDAKAAMTEPYWLRSERRGDLFAWPEIDARTFAFEAPELIANVKVQVAGVEIELRRPVQFRFADAARGEVRRDIDVVPAYSIALDRELIVVPAGTLPTKRTVLASVTNGSDKERTGRVELKFASHPDWQVRAVDSASFRLKRRGEAVSVPFEITIPAGASVGSARLDATVVESDGAAFDLKMNTVSYPHIQTHRYYTPSSAAVSVMDLRAVKRNIGYVMGSGDEVPDALRQMGMSVTMLEEKDLRSSDLSRFDAIVVGIRASETRPDLAANNARLLEYAKNGGNVVFQYQRGNWTSLAPFPVNTTDTQKTTAGSIARVVDENAKVAILDPSSPIFTTPNKITESDFSGWVQERNAYDLVTFDPKYAALLESHDASENENRGGLVVAPLGKGTWMYCSYSFFRQLPAGVPGAYRLFANIMSRPRS